MVVDKACDYRVMFSNWWVMKWKSVSFPNKVTHPINNSNNPMSFNEEDWPLEED